MSESVQNDPLAHAISRPPALDVVGLSWRTFVLRDVARDVRSPSGALSYPPGWPPEDLVLVPGDVFRLRGRVERLWQRRRSIDE